MAVFMIGYNLHPTQGEAHDDLLNAIQNVGTSSWHCLDLTWLVISDKTATQIQDELRPHIKDDDQLLIMRYGKGAAWFGFRGECWSWLKKTL